MVPSRGVLSGRSILVVEDSYLIAQHVCGLLEREGCTVVGPAAQLGRALALVRGAAMLDGAVLDINLNGQFCFPAAAALLARSVPFIFLTGYDNRGIIPAEFAAAPVLPKPIDEEALLAIAAATFGARGAAEDT